MTVFEVVKGQMGMVRSRPRRLDTDLQCFYLINSCVTAWVSITRIDNFLHKVSFTMGILLTGSPR